MDWQMVWGRLSEAVTDAWTTAVPKIQAMTETQWLLLSLVVVLWLYFRAVAAKNFLRGLNSGIERGIELADISSYEDDGEDDSPADDAMAKTYRAYWERADRLVEYAFDENRELTRAIINSSQLHRETLTAIAKSLVEHATGEHAELRQVLADSLEASADTLRDVANSASSGLHSVATRLTTMSTPTPVACRFVDNREDEDEDTEDDE